MNPKIAEMSEKWQVRGPQDGPAATYPTFDSDGVYRLYVLTIQRLEWWAMGEWERQAHQWRDHQMAVD